MDLLEKAAANPEKLELEGLNYNELVELKKNIETEINFLSNSFDQLRLAVTKFSGAREKLKMFNPEANDKDILIPLTSSIFIPGRLRNVDRIMFEVGASYFVEDTIPKATEFYNRKIESIKKNLTLISKIIENKTNQHQEVVLVTEDLIAKVKEDYIANQAKQ